MYIKQIIIQGFKSYKDQTVIEPFSPKTNVIVGRNGSGKSNFFAAIRFVLSDAYTGLGREERQALLHEGSGSAVTSAYVEIIFDNVDDRFPTGNKETVVRRTIGLKKDEYSLDRKASSKTDVMNLLETAGFSRSNPYYIVPQGRVTALTNMKESERLALLKEVAGTQVYETRRAESLKIMVETESKQLKIDELLAYIKDRLTELEEEKEELRAYQDKDRERRCLEFAYYRKEQIAVEETLDELEDLRQDGAGNAEENRDDFRRGEKAIAVLESDIHQLVQQTELCNIDLRQLEEDRRERVKAQAKAELLVRNLEETQTVQEQARREQEAELSTVRAEIQAREAELKRIAPEFNKRKAKEAEAKQGLDSAEAARNRLFAKQSRSGQFKNKSERDKWLKDEMHQLNMTLSQQKANRLEAVEEVKAVEKLLSSLEKDVAAARERIEGFGGSRGELQQRLTEAKDKFDKLSEARKSSRREDDKIEAMTSNARQELSNAERELSHAMDRATAQGLATIRRLKRDGDVPGAFGTLAELMQVSDAYRVPVEQIGGASLFHYIVDNEETATTLANALYRQHGGRVTFVPLSKLRPRQINLPRATDAVPLISKIQYEPAYEAAFQQVFGKTIICPNLTIAGQYARSHGVDGITPDGDTTNKRGAMTGGYIDLGRSRLDAVRAVSTWRKKMDDLEQQSRDLRRDMEKKDQAIATALGELRKTEQQLRQMDEGFEPLRLQLRAQVAQLTREREHLESATARRENIENNMKDFSEAYQAHEAEMAQEFKKALSAVEERDLERLTTQVAELQRAWNEASKGRRELENRKQSLEMDLRQNLSLKLDQLNSQAFEDGGFGGGGAASFKDAQRELKKARQAVAGVQSEIAEVKRQIAHHEASTADAITKKAQMEASQNELAKLIEKQQKKMEKAMQQKALLTARAVESNKNIKELGVLPDDAFNQKLLKLDNKTITTRIKKVNEALKKYSHVNKKAFEQYNSFTNQQGHLLDRRTELENSHASIEELVRHLDMRKDEAIERTFKQVSREFANIFERLVPAGHGRLVIQRRADRGARQQPDPEDSDDEVQRGSVENYTGVGISVSFNSKEMDEQQKIQQLSGGQKSLCALCLIFALQQTESSPMVIFDEVDANLDAQYRTAVAGLLQSISDEAGTQFICTTFRPEIVHIASKCYGVTFTNKTSSIDCVPTEDALSFVEGQKR